MKVLIAILSFALGALFGVGAMCCFFIAGKEDEELEKLNKELDYYRGFKESVMKKLSNERFVNNAPAAVVEGERKKLADAETKIKTIEESITALKK